MPMQKHFCRQPTKSVDIYRRKRCGPETVVTGWAQYLRYIALLRDKRALRTARSGRNSTPVLVAWRCFWLNCIQPQEMLLRAALRLARFDRRCRVLKLCLLLVAWGIIQDR